MSLPQVAIILLSYNDWTETLKCLDSLSRVTYPNLQIIAVDNGSSHPPLDTVRAKFPELIILENGRNLGYAEGNNAGLHYALEQGADYVLVLNNDTIVARDFVDRLVEVAEQQSDVAFLGPLVYHYDEPNVIQSAGGLRRANWQFYHRGQNDDDQGQYQTVDEVTWVTGCSIMGHSSLLKKIGLLDPEFFIYSEEVDWCLRALEAGYRVLFVPQAKVWHKGVRRHYDPSPAITYYSVRNEFLLLIKHQAGWLPISSALSRHLRTLTSYTLRPRWRRRRKHRDAIARALLDFFCLRFGRAPADF